MFFNEKVVNYSEFVNKIEEIEERLEILEVGSKEQFDCIEYKNAYELSPDTELQLGKLYLSDVNNKINLVFTYEATSNLEVNTYLKLNDKILGYGMIFKSDNHMTNIVVADCQNIEEGTLYFCIDAVNLIGNVKNLKLYIKGDYTFRKLIN